MLLDDPLSAVDSRVGSQLFFGCLLAAMRDRGKGVVLATHQLQVTRVFVILSERVREGGRDGWMALWTLSYCRKRTMKGCQNLKSDYFFYILLFLQYMQHADRILALDKDGKQIFYGTYEDLQGREDVFAILSASIGDKGEGGGEGEGEREVTIEDTSAESCDDTESVDIMVALNSYIEEDDIPTPTELTGASTPFSLYDLEGGRPSSPPSPATRSDLSNSGGMLMDESKYEEDTLESQNPPCPSHNVVTVSAIDSKTVDRTSMIRTALRISKKKKTIKNLIYDVSLSSRGQCGVEKIKKRQLISSASFSPGASASTGSKSMVLHMYNALMRLIGREEGSVDGSPSNNVVGKDKEDKDTLPRSVSQIIVSEDRAEGRLSLRIWQQYLRAGTVQHSTAQWSGVLCATSL